MHFVFVMNLWLVFSVMLSFFMVPMLNSQIVTCFIPRFLYFQTNIMVTRVPIILKGV